MERTRQKVDWAYDVWEQLKEGLANFNNYTKRLAQFFYQLAISNPEGLSCRMGSDKG
ncbi:hypothetical protein NCCP28_09980 [Niallia sp. NCCP-28]|nr:hypothetical protein NCCP28_09980 [Niallia sp. NCCP-28]